VSARPVRDRRGDPVKPRAHVYVRSGPHRGRSGVCLGYFRGASDLLALAFFDRHGELSNREKPHRSKVDDIVRADRCEVVLA
jgi:hypothetical protein